MDTSLDCDLSREIFFCTNIVAFHQNNMAIFSNLVQVGLPHDDDDELFLFYG